MLGVPFFDLHRQHEELRSEINDALSRVVSSGRFILGPEVEAFEGEWAQRCGVRHCVGVGSGTAAITLVLAALGVGNGDEVIVPANTFVASAFPILQVGATPVLVDCDDDALLDVAKVAGALSARTRAVIAVHLYGRRLDVEALMRVCRDVPVIEDACQAHGTTIAGRAGCFSFYPSKNLGALGDGGAVTSDDEELAAAVRRLRDLGQHEKYVHVSVGSNERLDELQAAILRVKLPHLRGWNARRAEIAARYTEVLSASGIQTPAGGESVWHLYVVRAADRDTFRAGLHAAGVETGLHYPVPLHLQPPLHFLGFDEGAFPVAEEWSRSGVSLPMFPELTDDEIEIVVRAANGRS